VSDDPCRGCKLKSGDRRRYCFECPNFDYSRSGRHEAAMARLRAEEVCASRGLDITDDDEVRSKVHGRRRRRHDEDERMSAWLRFQYHGGE
jgi:hypothetical protein